MISTSQKRQGISCSFRSDQRSLNKGQLDQWRWQAAFLPARKMPGRDPNKTPFMVPNSEGWRVMVRVGHNEAHYMPTGHRETTGEQQCRRVWLAPKGGNCAHPRRGHCPSWVPGCYWHWTLWHRQELPAAITSDSYSPQAAGLLKRQSAEWQL